MIESGFMKLGIKVSHSKQTQSLLFIMPCIGVVFEKSYLGSILAMKLNSTYAAVLFDGKVQLHTVSTFSNATNNSSSLVD